MYSTGMTSPSRSALILCGGQSSRMGRDKALLPFGSEALLTRVTRLVASAVPDVTWVARDGQALPPTPTPIVRDPVDGLGPLAAIATGLAAAAGQLVFVTACDLPFLEPRLILRLFDRLADADVSVPVSGGFPMTMCAVYRRSVVGEAARLVAAGELSVRALLDGVHTTRVDVEELRDTDPFLNSFLDCDTPESYAAALARQKSEGRR